MFEKTVKLYDVATKKTLIHLQHPLLLIFRLYFGYQFFLTGRGKLRNIEGVTGFFDSLGIPAPEFHAYFVGGLEMIGGIALLLGVASRFFALPLSFSMIVAYVTADKEAVSMLFKNPDLFLGADPYNFLLMSTFVLIFGPGIFSVDAVIRKLVDKKLDSKSAGGPGVAVETPA